MDIDRIRALSGLNEEQDDDAFMAAIAREKAIEALIRHAFGKLHLDINYNNYSVRYEDSTREAEVMLEEDRFDLKMLMRLYETGLSDNFEIVHHTDALAIAFTVAAELDNAQPLA